MGEGVSGLPDEKRADYFEIVWDFLFLLVVLFGVLGCFVLPFWSISMSFGSVFL